MALSVDSLFSHLAWIRLIHDRFGIEINFPIVEDPTLAIGRAYGMVAPDEYDASSVRATLFIDPDGVLQASTCYPATVGRLSSEARRVGKECVITCRSRGSPYHLKKQTTYQLIK